MKKILITVALSFLVLICFTKCSKESAVVVPDVVKKTFTATFPKASDAEWGIEKPGEFEVEFKLEKAKLSALFDSTGVLIETETAVAMEALPDSAKATIAKDFAGFKIGKIEKTDAKGVVTYEMMATKDVVELVFNQNGKLLNKEVVKKEKEDKEDKSGKEEKNGKEDTNDKED